MARTAHVRINTAVCTVRSPSHVRCPIHLDVINHKGVHIKSLHICIRLCVLQKLQQEFSGLDGPSSLRTSVSFGLCFTTNTSVKPSERNDLFLSNHVFQVPVGFPNVHFLDGLSCFSCVLKVNTKIGATCYARLGWILQFSGIFAHCVGMVALISVTICSLI